MWEGSIHAKESLLFLFVCLARGRDVFTCNEAYTDAKLKGGGWT
jgi:hypothetical protein